MTSQYGAYVLLDKRGYMHTRASTRPRARAHACACERTHICTYSFSTATIIRERASVLRYTYIGCLVWYYHLRKHAVLQIF
jgi:hypothetical protein